MIQEAFVSLIYNAALLLAMGIIFESIALRSFRSKVLVDIFTGICLAAVVLAVMVNPWVLSPGLVFDTRSIALSITSMFFGVIPSLITTAVALTYRIYMGGVGVYTGSCVIVGSILLGWFYKKMHHHWKKPYSTVELYSLGVVNHLAMLGWMLLLPKEMWMITLRQITIPVLIIYPIATVLLGKVMVRSLLRRQKREELEQSERRYRNLYDNAPVAYQSLDAEGRFITVNRTWLKIMGYAENEVLGRSFGEFVHSDGSTLFEECFQNFKAKGITEATEFTLVKKDGTLIKASFEGNIFNDEEGNFKHTQCIFIDITERMLAEENLRRITAEWENIFQAIPHPTFILDSQQRVIAANHIVEKAVGKSSAEMQNKQCWELMHDEGCTCSPVMCPFSQSYTHPDGAVSEMEVEALNGWYHVTCKPIYGADGKLDKVIHIAMDITERKMAERTLADSEEKYRLLAETAQDIIIVHDMQGFLHYANKVALDFFGGTPETVNNHNIVKFIAPEYHAMMREHAKQRLEGYTGHRLYQLSLINQHGKRLLAEISATPLIYEGQTTKILVVARDITERVLAEEQRNRYARRLEILRKLDSIVLENLPLPMVSNVAIIKLQELIPYSILALCILDGSKVEIISMNKRNDKWDYLVTGKTFTLETGFASELARRRNIVINDVSEADPRQNMPIRGRLMVDGMQSFMYNALLMQDELVGYLWFSAETEGFFTTEYLEVAAEYANQLAIVLQHQRLVERIKKHTEDLEQTVAERTKQLQEANLELESFSYSVAHDLRSPLKIIDGFCSILQEDYSPVIPGEAKSLLKTIGSTAQRMDTLIRELLNLARLNRNELTISEVDMAEMAKNSYDEVINARAAKGFAVDIKALPRAYADPALVNQVWQNLIENAIKFSQYSDTKKVEIGYKTIQNIPVYYVRDFGVGFEMENKDKIFGAFQRVHSNKDFDGTGIGLATVKKIVERHGGKVWAESTVGKGTTIFFTLA